MSGEAQRNENVAVYLIDNNAIKESNVRVGTTPRAVAEATADTTYWASEHGQQPARVLMLRPQQPVWLGWHGEGFYQHQNSVFNARTFFQVGAVKPSHRNVWGGRATGSAGKLGFLTLSGAQRDIRGMVNGNVLVPLVEERTPLATDAATRAIVQRFLDAFPNELPNRPDFDPRALNTNSPQRIDEVDGTARLDVPTERRGKLLLSHNLTRQRILAFQLVAGQNPNTAIHTHRTQATWSRSFGPQTRVDVGGMFSRTRTLLISEPRAVGPRVRFGFQIEELGPDSQFPINRAANAFRYGAAFSHTPAGSRHTFTAGGDVTRFQLNGVESANVRGYFQFTNNFGRQAIENLRLGTPSTYEVTLGELYRSFRNWTVNGYVADRWRLHPRLQLYYGVRYTADTRPTETRNRNQIPYRSDLNNFSPRFSLAWQMGGGWTMRAMYTTSFSQILPVTYQQIRNNPPEVRYIQVQNPSLVDPLAGVNVYDASARYSPTFLAEELVAPYSHQYNASWERTLAGSAILRVSYIGSRTIKMLNNYILNRADLVPGIPTTPATVDQRRPDPRYYETRWVVNGGIAYFDAGQATLDLPLRRGLTGGLSYTFSKAIDTGSDFSATAANRDMLTFRSQYQYEAQKDRRGLSNFDSPHSFSSYYSYDLPKPAASQGWWANLLGGWQISGVTMWKRGTPLTLFIGSDAPGFGNVDGGPSDRPNILDPSILGKTLGLRRIRSRLSGLTWLM
jgi:hypothetical protein